MPHQGARKVSLLMDDAWLAIGYLLVPVLLVVAARLGARASASALARTQRPVRHLLAAATAESIIGTDLDGTITAFNAGAERMLGYSASEAVDRMRLEDLHVPEEILTRTPGGRGTALSALLGAAGTGFPQTSEWTYVRAGGDRLRVEVTVSPVPGDHGEIVGYLALGRDITQQLRQQHAMEELLAREQRAMDELRRIDQMRNDFVSTVSHELRTPLTSIAGYLELLGEGDLGQLTDGQQEAVEVLDRNCSRLRLLIEDLLLLSDKAAGTFDIAAATADLRAILDGATSSVAPIARSKGVGLWVDAKEGEGGFIGDAEQLQRAVTNLLSNAVKFTSEGGRVRLRGVIGASQVTIQVQDTGIGIAAPDQAELFTGFFRSAEVRAQEIQGAGVGLSIVKTIIDQHGGLVDVASQVGKGTTVTITLPRHGRATQNEPGE
jgi:PAS domain S-box-containing protein